MLRVYDLRAVGFSCKSYPGTIVTTSHEKFAAGLTLRMAVLLFTRMPSNWLSTQIK
jgi:hypothetical protein